MRTFLKAKITKKGSVNLQTEKNQNLTKIETDLPENSKVNRHLRKFL